MVEAAPPDSPRNDAYEEAQRRLHEHPGYIEYLRIQAFSTTLLHVFSPNWRELMSLLNAVSTDVDLALRMAQDLGGPVAAEVTRRLHNYVTSAMTLVDHCRRLLADRSGRIVSEYERRKVAILGEPEIPFIQGLRNFSLHRSLPLLGYTLSVTRDSVERSEVQLSVPDLLEGDRWSAGTRQFIATHGERLALRPVMRKHHDLVFSIFCHPTSRRFEIDTH
jgi:hypothetical protein